MDITLRKATKLRSKLENRLKELRQLLKAPAIQVSPLDESLQTQITEAREEWKRNFARQGVVKGVLTSLRNKIAAKNSDSYISVRITELASVKTQRDLLSEILRNKATPSDDTLAAQIATARTQQEVNGYCHDLSVSILSADDLAVVKKLDRELEKAAEATHEAVEGMNANLTITLSDEEVAFLTAEEIL